MVEEKGFRFRPEMHIRKGWEFRRAYRAGGRARGRLVTLVVTRNRLRHSRLGLSVGKKVGGAVRRNKIKRIVREAYRLTRWEIEARAGAVDIVVIPNLPEGRYELAEMLAELPPLVARALEKAGKRRRPGKGRRGGKPGKSGKRR